MSSTAERNLMRTFLLRANFFLSEVAGWGMTNEQTELKELLRTLLNPVSISAK